MSKIYKNDIGTKIKLDAGCDISATGIGATVWKIIYSKPGSTRVKGEWTAIAEGTNYAYYVTVANDLNVIGTWQIQLYIESPTWKGYGEMVSFVVCDNLV